MAVLTIFAISAGFVSCADEPENKNDTGNDPENESENLIFSDDFDGTELNKKNWDLCPEWDRQGRSTWKDDMVSVSGGNLHLKFKRDAVLGASKSTDKTIADNWIRAGGVRTRKKNDSIIFQNSYGYYEARIKFPVVSGTWGAFWLMGTTVGNVGNGEKTGRKSI
ncbi:glycoside hydrolase family 16 protein [Treponema sp. R6D11]